MQYGVEQLAKALGVQPASARVALRKAGVKSPYAWDSKTIFEKVKAKLIADKGKPSGKKKAKKTKKTAKKKTPAKRKTPSKPASEVPASTEG